MAVAAALLLVTASVLVGVWGKRLAESRAVDSLIPIGDITQVARQLQHQLELEALHRPTDAALPTSEDLSKVARENLALEWTPPDMRGNGYIAVMAGSAPLLENGSAMAVLYELEGEQSDRFLALFALPDEGEFAVFDDFGRARVFESAQSILEPDDATDPTGPATLAWSDGTLLFIARAGSRDELMRAHAALGAP